MFFSSFQHDDFHPITTFYSSLVATITDEIGNKYDMNLEFLEVHIWGIFSRAIRIGWGLVINIDKQWT
jgi:hypothetical protein